MTADRGWTAGAGAWASEVPFGAAVRLGALGTTELEAAGEGVDSEGDGVGSAVAVAGLTSAAVRAVTTGWAPGPKARPTRTRAASSASF